MKFDVTGMSCEGCVKAVTRAIRAQDPEARVSVDLAAGTVAVEGKISPEAARGAIAEAGFTINS